MRFFAILFFLVFVPVGAFGQIIPSLPSSIEIQTIPETPAPNTIVAVQVQNVANKNSVLFTWKVNGQIIEEGVGLNKITLTTGRAGAPTVVEVTVSDGGEVVDSITRTISPAEVSLVWEADTYTPPFYPGRPLSTGESVITIAAVPTLVVNDTRVSANSLVYTWYLNGSQAPFRSGFGLSTISLSPPIFDSAFSVRVVVTTQSGTLSAQDSVTIIPREPEIALYEKHPLLGTLFNRMIQDNFQSFDEELTLSLFPLFVVDPENSEYTWSVEGDIVDSGDTPRELTLRKTGSDRGTFSIRTSLETGRSIYERATRVISLTF